VRGQHIRVLEGARVRWPVALTAEEQRLGLFGMIDKYVGPTLKTLGDPRAPDWPPPPLLQYDRMTFAEFLRRQGASPAAVELLRPLYAWWGDGIEHVSALFLLRDSVLGLSGNRFYTIRGGNDLLPKAFAARLSERIRYGAAVTRIEHDARHVRITFTQGGAPREVTGDCAVCTIPFSVLRHVDVSPAFSPGKRRAIAELPYTSVARVYLQSRTKFWLDGGPNGWTYTDLPIMNVLDSTFNQRGRRGVLHAYMAGAQARRVTAMSEAERVRSTLEQMEQVHPGIREQFEVGASKCWDEDEWARGAYAWFRPGQMGTLVPFVGSAEGRVHFAGDHASSLFGWMQGALESGNRAAREVNDAA
jgi:monoamine oxidase